MPHSVVGRLKVIYRMRETFFIFFFLNDRPPPEFSLLPLPAPLPFGGFPPVQFGSPLAGIELSEDRFWPGANSALILKPLMFGDSYHAACESLVSNSARLSPPVLQIGRAHV